MEIRKSILYYSKKYNKSVESEKMLGGGGERNRCGT